MSLRRLGAIAALISAPILVAQAAPGWPKTFDGMECTGLTCDPVTYTAYADGSVMRSTDGVRGTYTKSGVDITALFMVDLNGDGVPDAREEYTGVFDAASGCASGTYTTASGRDATWQACR